MTDHEFHIYGTPPEKDETMNTGLSELSLNKPSMSMHRNWTLSSVRK